MLRSTVPATFRYLSILSFLVAAVAAETAHAQIGNGERLVRDLDNASRPARAVADTAEEKPPKGVENVLQRLQRVEAELARLNKQNGPGPAQKREAKVHVLLEHPFVGSLYTYRTNNPNPRFFAARLIFANLTDKPVTVGNDDLKLVADGETIKVGEIPSQIRSRSFEVGKQSFYINNLKMPKQVKIAAGSTGARWVVFGDLPPGTQVPKLVLQMRLGGQRQQVDVNRFARGLLRLRVERIGPRRSLGLLTISGSLNTVNMGSLIEALHQLTVEKVVRAVIRWDESASPVDSQLLGWLQQSAQKAGQGEPAQHNQFPVVPVAIHELHLAELPQQNGTPSPPRRSSYGGNAPPRIHKTAREAAEAALSSAYEALPPDELLGEIRRGHPLTRAAALAAGGGRLPPDKLPLILQYAESDDARMQRAALVALRHFGERPALDTLLEYVKSGSGPLARVAIESLAASRYAAAHRALLKVLRSAAPEKQKAIVAVITRYPRPVWAETIYEFAREPGSKLAVDAVGALVQIGHPNLVDVLERSLQEGDSRLQNEALSVLVSRRDRRSEEIAMEYTLEHLRESPPTSQMLSLLNRTKDRRALPLLMKHFKSSQSNRSSIINTLAQIGDQTVADTLLAEYDSLKDQEKSSVLNLLRQLRSPRFRGLAGKALLSDDSSLLRAACEGLKADASPQAIELLADALEKSKSSRAWSYICNALYAVGTPQARAALLKARKSSDSRKRSYAVNALRNMRQSSPGYSYLYRARNYEQNKKWEEAENYYSLAIKLDPQLPEAFSGRGKLYLRQKKLEKAAEDFRRALKSDPYLSAAVSGLAMAHVRQGDIEQGLKQLEGEREKFQNERDFAYQSAAVYARALQQIRKDEKAAERQKKADQYRQKALAELKRAIKLGHGNLNAMKKDEDLQSLHDDPEFKKIVNPAPDEAAAAEAPAEAPANQTVPAVGF